MAQNQMLSDRKSWRIRRGRARMDPDICGDRAGERPDAIKLRGFCHLDDPIERGLYRPADLSKTRRRWPGTTSARDPL